MSYEISSPVSIKTESIPGEIRIEDSSSQFVSVRAPTTLSGDVDFVLPDESGTTGYVITKGAMGLEWTNPLSLPSSGILSATEPIVEANWSGNTDYAYSVSVPGVVVGDFCAVQPDENVYATMDISGSEYNGYAYCTVDGTVEVVNRITTFITVPPSSTFTIKVIQENSGVGTTDAENIGTGAGVYAQKVGTNIQLRSILGGTGINVTENIDTVEVELDTTPATVKYRTAYVAERNSTASGKLALGNGSTSIGMGAVIADAGELVAVCVSTTASATGGIWNIEINEVSVSSTVHNGRTTVDNITPVAVAAGDYINAVQVNNGAGGNHTVTFYVEHTMPIDGVKGDTGDTGPAGADGIAQVRTGNGVPSNGLGGDGDLYIDNLNGDYYTKSGGVWFLDGNLKGPSGSTPDYIKLTNTATTNMNSSPTGVIFAGIDTTPLLDTNPGAFTVISDTITVNATGLYEAYFNFVFSGTVQRSNVAVQFVINGTPTGRISNSDYIRATGGHISASTSLLEPFSLSNGDTIQIQGSQNAASGIVSTPLGQSLIWIKRLN